MGERSFIINAASGGNGWRCADRSVQRVLWPLMLLASVWVLLVWDEQAWLLALMAGGLLLFLMMKSSSRIQKKDSEINAAADDLQRYRLVVESAIDVFFQTDEKARWTYLNPAWEQVTGRQLDETLGEELLDSVYADDRDKARALIAPLLAGEEPFAQCELRLKTLPESYRWVELVVRPFGRVDQGISGLTGTIRNITAKRLAEEALRENEERYRRIFLNIQDVYFEASMGGILIEISPSVEHLLGYRRDQLVGRLFSTISAEPGRMAEIREKLLESPQLKDFELQLRRRSGETIACSINISLICDAGGKPLKLVGSIRDITERKRAEEEIRKLAYHDILTGLPNRSLFYDRLDQALAQASRHDHPLSLLFLDLDRFKDVNDTLGHDAGDRLLQAVAERLRACVRQSDTVARLGGDEFVVLLTSVKTERDGVTVAEKILELLAEPVSLDGKTVFTSTSIGVVMYPHDGRNAETLLRHADMAMYAAKEKGRNNFQFFSEEMNRNAYDRHMLEHRLREAIEKEHFQVYYQPQWDMQTRSLIGLEALVRWIDPEEGMISPARFIPVAEETGLIRPLGEWVLRSACAQVQAWHKEGFPQVRVGVNISGRQFRQPDLVAMIDRILAETGLPAEFLELELTESYLMEDAEATNRILAFLKVRGIDLAIDDFGTGYSSLNYLKNFPIDRIKIDQSFIRDVTGSRDDAAIVEAIIGMAQSLELDVIAEGVETAEQLKFLQSRGCQEMQGYFFARPMPVDEVSRYLAENRDRLRLPRRGDDRDYTALLGDFDHLSGALH